MYRIHSLLIIAWLILVVPPAVADWNRDTLSPGQAATLTFTNTTTPSVVRTYRCSSTTIWLPNPDSSEVYFWRCDTAVYSATTCDKILNDTDGDGLQNDVTFNGVDERRGRRDVRAHYIGLTIPVAPTTSATARVECF